MTVQGPLTPVQLGVVLPHEHVMVDFVGAAQINPGRYDPEEVYRVALPFLEQAYRAGTRSLVECTPAFLGRDPSLLRRLSKASGLHLLTNTGYYGAGRNKYLPAHALDESADQLAARWIGEFEHGIEGTGIFPGFIKIGVDTGSLSAVHRKLVMAAAKTHQATGLTIAAHTGDGVAAREQIELLQAQAVHPSAWIWVHAQSEKETQRHVEAAAAGAWVEFDGLNDRTWERHLQLVRAMKQAGQLHRVLLSHDAGWYHVGEPGGGQFKPFDFLLRVFLPKLADHGFTVAELNQLTVENPQRAFTLARRLARS